MEVQDETISVDEAKEKSIFEKTLIEAFKQQQVYECEDKLESAYQSLPSFISEIKNSSQNKTEKDTKKTPKTILNLNILDKFKRLTQRNYINIHLVISKIFYTILDATNFQILSNDSNILIDFSNTCINILDLINSYSFSNNLVKRIITFLKYLETTKILNDEQMDIVTNLQKSYSEKILSNDYNNFQTNYEKDILSFCSKDELSSKEQGLTNLYSYFFKLKSLNEQFDLLCEHGHLIIKSLINLKNPGFVQFYYRVADYMTTFIFNYNYVIKIDTDSEEIKYNQDHNFVIDNMDRDINDLNNLKLEKVDNLHDFNNLKFLEGKYYSIDEQKNILLNYNNIFYLCVEVVNCIKIYETSFKCQYISFTILKRLYFVFPKFRNEIQDLITTILVNLVSFKSEVIKGNNPEPYEMFLKFLLTQGEQNLKEKLTMRLTAQKSKIEKNFLDEQNNNIVINKKSVEYDDLYLNDFKLKIGFPMNQELIAGTTFENLIDVKYPESILYIAFNSIGMDITFHLLKYCPLIKGNNYDLEYKQFEGQQYFYEIFKLERVGGGKVIMYVKSPGIYKVVFDNRYSWFNSKFLRFRIHIFRDEKYENMGKIEAYKNTKINEGGDKKNIVFNVQEDVFI